MKGLFKYLPLGWLLWLATLVFRVAVVKTGKQKRVFQNLWTSIWVREGYAHEGEPLPKIETHYARFDNWSTDLILYFLIWPIGTMRLIWDNQEAKMPVINDFEITGSLRRPIVELTLLVLKPDWRGLMHLPSLVLWRAGYQMATARGMREIVMAADRRLFHLLKRIFSFRQIGPKKFYEGSDTIPAALDLDQAKIALGQTNQGLLKFFVP